MNIARMALLLGGVSAGLVGCGTGDETGSAGTGQPPELRSVSILVDANRDGFINDLDDNVDKTLWDKVQGAAFLANLDDDDLDKKRDFEDEVVNGDTTDAYDLGRIILRGFAGAPAGATGVFSIDPAAAPYVRVFRHDGMTWTKVLDATTTVLTLTEEQVKKGIELGIEGKTLVGLPEAGTWSGFVQLDYTVSVGDKPIVTATSPDGHDLARVRVAPWLMFGNSTPRIDTVFSAADSKVFVAGLDAAITEANAKDGPVSYWQIKNWPGDQWVEDYFQTGVASVPWSDGQVAGMRIAMPRPWGRSDSDKALPVNWLAKSHLYQDSGYFVVYKKAFSGSSFDSHGNHDLLPPYTNGDQSFPYGRIIHGSGVLPETKAFYNAQEAQAPTVTVKTDWLYVGHVDEFFSYAPAATPRGWKLLVASPKLGRSMLEEWQKNGHGAVEMFVGKKWSDGKAATISIDDALADPDLMAASQKAQGHIDPEVVKMKLEVGLTDDDIVFLPTLFEAISDGGNEYNVAYQPGVVNSRIFNGTAIVPDPFGPMIDGEDGVKKFVTEALGTDKHALGADGKGLHVAYADDWSFYHVLDGEVHCGSNQEGPPQPEWQWWNRMLKTEGVSK